MHVIPVIDVKGGVAVAARGGDRDNYRPLVSPLAASADPLAVAQGYIGLFAFPVLYIADLDGIEGGGASLTLIERLAAALPTTELWVDNGASTVTAVSALADIPRITAVVGSEGGIDAEEQARIVSRFRDRIALSLDFKGGAFLGQQEILEATDAWPTRVIAMTLARVGSGAGPDVDRIAEIARAAGPDRRVYAAGGIRSVADLAAARAAGAAGALIATALHSGQIKTGDLVEIAGKKFRST